MILFTFTNIPLTTFLQCFHKQCYHLSFALTVFLLNTQQSLIATDTEIQRRLLFCRDEKMTAMASLWLVPFRKAKWCASQFLQQWSGVQGANLETSARLALMRSL
ncbi:hypothetical protein CDAR_39801 [Caerostris darwini]|uniref:Secreted protein n=1 Tax=Caerostris darwini TaxID=1538125 RepID=A0AAV4U6M5_9ARAC|nr:hypothetical protein CDAR_39801 [Caerostris darwini]